ncbi:hypothetical protein Ahy_A05g022589 [Arachis hypogaea]|uniref:MOCS2A n=1 Tax=Arachis hypogaea TaxID=3818 RepID=A0A445D136_ARAHY|nr:hypothetical protein Ahy_A05g022589 [Arachis hypogaea]
MAWLFLALATIWGSLCYGNHSSYNCGNVVAVHNLNREMAGLLEIFSAFEGLEASGSFILSSLTNSKSLPLPLSPLLPPSLIFFAAGGVNASSVPLRVSPPPLQEADTMNGDSKKESSLVKIKVLFFVRARDITGLSEMPLEVSSRSTTQDYLKKLLVMFLSLEEIQGCVVLALNEEYAVDTIVVQDEDELAIIPPISGG